jgi:L-seryl-tRNA(Ser) seleniumtransferase
MPTEALQAGADVVAFSGDKLLGGPQAGIVLGTREAIRRIVRHPLARAVRPDKITLAALTATLLSYARGRAQVEIPVWQMIAQSGRQIEDRAEAWRHRAAVRGLSMTVVAGESAIGGGSLPGETLPTTLIALPPAIKMEALRSGTPAVVARTQAGRVLLDLRTVAPEEEEGLLEAVEAASLTP